MSLFKKPKEGYSLADTINKLSTGIERTKGTITSEHASTVSAGLENFDENRIGQARNKFDAVEQQIMQMLPAESVTQFGSAGLESATIALAAVHGPDTYVNAARKAPRPTGSHIFGSLRPGVGGELQYSVGTEAFDTQNITKHAQISVAYNLAAPRQDEVGEMWYPIIIATPDQAFYKVSLRRPTVYNGVIHAEDGSLSDFNKHNLMDAYRDHSILKNETTRLIPYANDKTAALLAPEAEIATTEFELAEGLKVPTRPLVVGKDINLLGICQHPELKASGLLTQQTQIDRNVRVTDVYVEVSNEDGTSKGLLRFDTTHLPTNQFYKAQEGQGYEGMLRFRPRSIIVDANTKQHNGTDVAPLADFVAAGLTAQFEMVMDGDINYEQGAFSVRASAFRPRVIKNAQGESVPLDHASLAGLTFTVKYVKVEARMTNSDKKTRGLLLDSDLWEEIYEVPLLAPFVCQFPVSDEKHEILTVETLVEATHIQLANSCVTTMFNYAETLDNFYRANMNNLRAASIEAEGIEGIGRLLVTPFYEEVEIDLLELVNNLTSSDKLADISGAFRTVINELSYRAAQKSGYIPVLRQQTKNPNAKPKLLVATDQILPSFMMLTGDDRFSGIKMDHTVASSPDSRFEGEVFMSFGGLEGEFNPLNSGNLIYIPELVSTIQTPRNGGVLMESMVQPRFRHVNNLPIMFRLRVKNLDALAQKRTRLDVNTFQQQP